MESEFANVNWIAVILGTVAAFLVGWLWYSPKLFGRGWAAGSGVELGSAQSMPVFARVSQLVGLVLLALVVVMEFARTQAAKAQEVGAAVEIQGVINSQMDAFAKDDQIDAVDQHNTGHKNQAVDNGFC